MEAGDGGGVSDGVGKRPPVCDTELRTEMTGRGQRHAYSPSR